jgi:hypothetical protein
MPVKVPHSPRISPDVVDGGAVGVAAVSNSNNNRNKMPSIGQRKMGWMWTNSRSWLPNMDYQKVEAAADVDHLQSAQVIDAENVVDCGRKIMKWPTRSYKKTESN